MLKAGSIFWAFLIAQVVDKFDIWEKNWLIEVIPEAQGCELSHCTPALLDIHALGKLIVTKTVILVTVKRSLEVSGYQLRANCG